MFIDHTVLLTDTTVGAAHVGIALTAALGVLLTILSTQVLGSYGLALFALTPVYLDSSPRSRSACGSCGVPASAPRSG